MKLSNNCLGYIFAPLLSLATFCLIFKIWNLDLTIPSFSYNNDSLFSLFIIKNIIVSGHYACSDNIGWPHLVESFCLYDFPMQSDMFQILVIKFMTLFTSNPFLVANLFFIATFMMISTTSFIALRQFGISVFTALLISDLYAFVPYHFARNVWHLFLSNYALIPLSIMVAFWIATDKISIFYVNAKGQYSVRFNKNFWIAFVIAVVAAGNNVYYAYYSCIIFIFVWFLNGLRKGKFMASGTLEVVLLCLTTFMTLFYLYLPTLFYEVTHGFNGYQVARGTVASEIFGLRIIDLFMPVANHYIKYLSVTRMNFDNLVDAEGERIAESLGFIGSVGFLFLFVWLLGKGFNNENSLVKRTIKRLAISEDEQNTISYLAKINILITLFAAVDGFVMLIAISFPTLRSHARIAIFISFISLFLVAIIFDKLRQKKLFGKKIHTQIVLVVIVILGIFDQVGSNSGEVAQAKWMREKYYSDREFITHIESSLPEKSQIFILPNYGFPEYGDDDYRSVIAYAHSEKLRWSYPVVSGRDVFFWQNKVTDLPFDQFIQEIKNVGFVGVYIDREQYEAEWGLFKLLHLEKFLKSIAHEAPFVSQNKKLVFYHI